MTLVLLGKRLALGDWPSKIEVIWFPGIQKNLKQPLCSRGRVFQRLMSPSLRSSISMVKQLWMIHSTQLVERTTSSNKENKNLQGHSTSCKIIMSAILMLVQKSCDHQLEVGSLSYYLQGFINIPRWLSLGFLNHLASISSKPPAACHKLGSPPCQVAVTRIGDPNLNLHLPRLHPGRGAISKVQVYYHTNEKQCGFLYQIIWNHIRIYVRIKKNGAKRDTMPWIAKNSWKSSKANTPSWPLWSSQVLHKQMVNIDMDQFVVKIRNHKSKNQSKQQKISWIFQTWWSKLRDPRIGFEIQWWWLLDSAKNTGSAVQGPPNSRLSPDSCYQSRLKIGYQSYILQQTSWTTPATSNNHMPNLVLAHPHHWIQTHYIDSIDTYWWASKKKVGSYHGNLS